ncbi:hypothetical protein [Microbacterium sp.]|uniref:hypothetical protein n=1 Tax=Microbacterium sp. TaxID=51671 RepID=UPI00289922A2|nr:hypothetical protein [Microbacterium sp.]
MVIAAVGIAWLLALRPLSFGDVVLVLVVALLVWWVTELLQRRPGEQADETTDAAAHTAASVDVAS